MSNIINRKNLSGLSYTRLQVGNQQLKFLIDSGASISLIKYNCVGDKHRIDGKQLRLCGVNGMIENRGCITIPLTIGKGVVNQRMCVIDEIECGVDGILGGDFFNFMGAMIDYSSQCIRIPNSSIVVPMESVNLISIEIPERCEKIIEVEVDDNADLVIMPTEVCAGVFTAAMIVRPVKGRIPVRLLNVNEKRVTLHNLRPDWVRLSQFECINFNKLSSIKSTDRVEQLLESVNLNHLNQEERDSIQKIIAKFHDVFHLPEDSLSVTNLFSQNIRLKPDATPTYAKPYRLPNAQKAEINKQVHNMLKADIIEPTASEWSSPLLLVPKKSDPLGNRKWRLVIDYRLVNKTLQDDKYPLPNITEILDSLGGAVYFTHLDLAQGYYQLEIDELSRPVTAFTVPSGQYQMKRLPMGLKISPAAFSRMMTVAMSGLNLSKCFTYLDDLIVFGKNLLDHNYNLFAVLNRLRDVNLKLNVDKCQFLKKSIVYLGHTISEQGILPDESKIEAITLFPRPTRVEEVKRFVAMVN